MSGVSENKKIIINYFSAIEKKDFEAIGQLFAADHFFNFPMSARPLDNMGHLETLKSLVSGFPDLKYTIEKQVGEDNKVATRGTLKGTHLGIFNGIEPTGKKIEISFTEIHRIKEGKIGEEWFQMDRMSLMQQIGAMS